MKLFPKSLKWLYLQVIKGKVEEVELPEKADILISEPMGNLSSLIANCGVLGSI